MARSLGLEHTHAMLLSLRSIMLVAGAVTLWHPQRTQEVLQEHQAVLDRLAGHDRQGAVHAIRDHIEATRRAASGALQMGSPNIAASQQYSEVATDDRSITASLVRG
jgi:DNA-binding GntR family transcriptional regulator